MDRLSRLSHASRIRTLRHLAVLMLTALCAMPSTAAAAGGIPTPGFGSGGVAQLGAAARVNGVAVQDDARPVAAGFTGGSMLVQRLSTAGVPEPAFAAGPGVANAVAIQPDGKIVVVGRSSANNVIVVNGNMVVKRFNANGSPDTGFGAGGTVTLGGSVANAVAIALDGKIVIGGAIIGDDGFPRVALARLGTNGAPDTGFGAGGLSKVDLGPGSQARSVAVQADGKVVFGGEQIPDLQAVNALIGRVGANGALDGSFGGGSGTFFYYHPKGGAASRINGVAVDSAGRIVGAGGDVQSSGSKALFIRLNANGAPDGSFGAGGVLTPTATVNYGGGDVVGARSVAIAGGGEIVAAGNFKDSGQSYAALWALTPGGQLDTSVGLGGIVLTLPNGEGGESNAVGVALDGNIFAAGNDVAVFPPGFSGGFVTRYTGFGPVQRPGGLQVVTGTASRVTASTATLAGTIRPGSAVTYAFEYGTTTRYGSRSSSRSLPRGAASVSVLLPVSKLRPGTTYHYRLTATSSAGKTVGGDRTFRTKALASRLTRLARSIRFSRVRSRGLIVSAKVNASAILTGSITVSKATARRLRLRGVSLGNGKTTLSKPGTARLRLRFSSAARKALGRKHGSIAVTVRVTATSGGKRVTKSLTTKLTL